MNKLKALAIANLTLGATIDFEKVAQCYFKNDGQSLKVSLAFAAKDPNKLFPILEQANYEIENDEVLATTSNFGKIQKEVVEQVITEDNKDFLEANIINNVSTINENKQCPEIDAASNIVEFEKQKTTFEYSKAA